MEGYLSFAQGLAKQAGRLIKDNFEKNVAVALKPDHSPVTEVDKQINQLVADAIKGKYPEHGLMGEEGDYGNGQEELQWLCDPLDGTKAFITGVPLSTFILGLTRAGELLLAVLYYPYTDRTLHAIKGHGAFCGGQPIHVDSTALADGGCVVVSESSFQFVGKLRASGAQIEPLPGAGYRAGLLAQGRFSGVVQGSGDFHDTGPISLIVEEAGGKVTDLHGQRILFNAPLNNGIIFSNGVCHDEILAAVR